MNPQRSVKLDYLDTFLYRQIVLLPQQGSQFSLALPCDSLLILIQTRTLVQMSGHY